MISHVQCISFLAPTLTPRAAPPPPPLPYKPNQILPDKSKWRVNLMGGRVRKRKCTWQPLYISLVFVCKKCHPPVPAARQLNHRFLFLHFQYRFCDKLWLVVLWYWWHLCLYVCSPFDKYPNIHVNYYCHRNQYLIKRNKKVQIFIQTLIPAIKSSFFLTLYVFIYDDIL